VKNPEILPQTVFRNSVFQLDSKEQASISVDFVARTFYIWDGGGREEGGCYWPTESCKNFACIYYMDYVQ
jgi:hypothetical protein